ncbi:hypothetical protein C8Q75DRAFT_771318 [Abortiporus biennis]|nr:hypothetical protein C8Q75DRAFT_771318 [Abortiporus biennis]
MSTQDSPITPNSGNSRISDVAVAHSFTDLDADIILRSRDGEDFRIYKVILSNASPVFQDMFTIPQPAEPRRPPGPQSSTSTKSDPPTVHLPERSEVLEWILRACYPMNIPKVQDLNQVYELLESEPLRVFAIAHRYSMQDLAKLSAYKCLNKSVTEIINTDIPEFKFTSAKMLQTLLRYHETCRSDIAKLTVDLRWIKGSHWIWFKCIACPGGNAVFIKEASTWCRQWWLDLMKQAAVSLSEKPVASQIVGSISSEISWSSRRSSRIKWKRSQKQ